ncbi:MAG: hypothetical protein M1503_10230 [Thaumarchaeota archaeon]|nr:hypothetical protein [Nitrososphaerota archaeon]MCL5318619.1 hypothetical protein [Nitrososphaerota archaeon]
MSRPICSSFNEGKLTPTCYGCGYLWDCHPRIEGENADTALIKMNYRLWRWKLTALSFLLFNLALSAALLLIWSGSAMNPQYLFCAETNRYGEFWLELAMITGTPFAMGWLWWRAKQ